MTTAVNGIFEIDGNYYYKKDGVIQKDLGLIKVGDDYYYVCWSGKLKTNSGKVIGTSQANGLLPAGWYEFGADGKMVANN